MNILFAIQEIFVLRIVLNEAVETGAERNFQFLYRVSRKKKVEHRLSGCQLTGLSN